VERLDAGVLEVLGPEDRRRLLGSVALEDLADPKDRERLAPLGRDQRHRLGTTQPVSTVLVDRQRDRDRPRQAVLEVHRLEHRVVVGLAREPGERRERADGEHLEIGELPFGDDEGRQVASLLAECLGGGAVDEELHERSSVGIDAGHGRSSFPGRWP
jgi:hypothetical protein